MPGDAEGRIELAAEQRERVHEQAEPLERVELALDRDEEGLGRDDGVDGEQSEARRRVDQHVVVVASHGLRARTAAGVRDARDRPARSPSRPARCRTGTTSRPGTARAEPRIGEGPAEHDDVVDAGLDAAAVDAEARRRVGLWVDVDQEHLPAHLGQGRPDADGRGGLADTALLVCDSEDGWWHG